VILTLGKVQLQHKVQAWLSLEHSFFLLSEKKKKKKLAREFHLSDAGLFLVNTNFLVPANLHQLTQ
jgi:hypothetical protein